MRGTYRTRQGMVAGLGIIVIAAALGITLAPGGATPAAPGARGVPEGQESAPDLETRIGYYNAVGQSLSPLLIHVRELPDTLRRFAGTDIGAASPESSVAEKGKAMAYDFATARDLVGRLTAPAPTVGDRYELAAMLYVESARTVEVLPSAGAAVPETARQGLRLRLLGDRLFDQAKRSLGDLRPGDGTANGAEEEVSMPSPVPDFVAEGIQAGPLPEPLRALGRQAGKLSGEEAVTARLALLVLADSLRASGADIPNAGEQGRRLWAIGERLWDITSLAPLPGPRSDARLLRTGGAFDGRPPPLRPGDDPGAGLPNGLPTVDARHILGGT